MTLNGVMAVILRYFSEFGYLPGVVRISSLSLSHLLMSSCLPLFYEGQKIKQKIKTVGVIFYFSGCKFLPPSPPLLL